MHLPSIGRFPMVHNLLGEQNRLVMSHLVHSADVDLSDIWDTLSIR